MKTKSEHIRTAGIAVIAMALLFAAYLYSGKKDRPPLQTRDVPEHPAGVLKGIVAAYGSNPDKDIDKLLLKNDSGDQWLHFPPNAAKAVLSVAQLNKEVTVTVNDAERRPPPDGSFERELTSVTNINTGRTVEVHRIPPPLPSEGKEVKITGTILDYVMDDKGNARSIVMSGRLITLPPPERDALLPLLVKNKEILVKGWERNADAGFVNADSLIIIRPYAVVIDGTEYSMR